MNSIVIGGGIVGASAAYHLARGGQKTLLIDNHDTGRATDAGAEIIAPETSGAALPKSFFPFSLRCGGYYPTLIGQLAEEDAGDTGYKVCGELIVAADEDELAAYEAKKTVVFERQRGRGLPSGEDLREISPEDARELFPALKTVLKALYFRGGARVDGRLLTAAMVKAALGYGLTLRGERAGGLLIENGRVTGVQLKDEAVSAGNVIIAGGAWSAAYGEQLGRAIPVEPQRGQIIHLNLSGTDTSEWAIVEAFHGHYLVCWPDGRVVAGATRETGAGFVPQTTADGVREVLGEAMQVAPGLRLAEIGEIRVGLRPATPDNLPVLGAIPGVEQLYISTGHGANGLQLGPLSGKLAADWASGAASDVDISAFDIRRFG